MSGVRFLQASLFTSVVAFGVAAMAFVLGLVLALIGRVMMQVSRESAGSSALSCAWRSRR